MSQFRAFAARRRAAAILSPFAFFAFDGSFALADDSQPAPSVELPPLVVSATRVPTPEDQLGSSITVITADDIANEQARTLPEVLANVPGLNIVQTGSPGGTTSVYMRGTNANHTKVLIDGIDVGDPSSVDGSFDFSQILASDLDRVEIVRGPQSGLYGADAIGGVINIVTKKGQGPARVTGSLEGGSFGTFNQTAGVSGSVARFNYAANFTHYSSTDTDVTPPNLVPAGRPLNPDSYDNLTYSTKLGANLADNFDVGVVARYVDTDLKSTSDDLAGPETLRSDSLNHELFTRGTVHWSLFDGAFDQTAGLGYAYYHRFYFDPNPATIAFGGDPSTYSGDRVKADWQGNIRVANGETVTIGAEHQVDSITDSTPVKAENTNNAGFAQLQSAIGERFFNAINLREDGNDRYGYATTWREAPSFLIAETGTRLKGSVGTGFKPPTLDELYDNYPGAFPFFGNPNLKPEKSLGYDAGFEQSLDEKRIQFGATWFHNDIKNLIADNAAFTSYVNVGHATTEGFENFVSYKPLEVLTLRADYTYTLANNDDLHEELPRRPKHKASVSGTWKVTDKASLTASVLYVGSWVDVSRDATVSGLVTPGYAVVNVAGSYDLGHGVAAFARIDNLTNRTYQDPIGFQRPGIGVFGGLSVTFADLGTELGLTK